MGRWQGSLRALGPAHQCYWPCGSAGRRSPASGWAPGWSGASPAPPAPSAAQGQRYLTSGLASAAVPAVGSTCEQPRPGERAAPCPPQAVLPKAPHPGAQGRGRRGPQERSGALGTRGSCLSTGLPMWLRSPLTWMAALRAWRAFSSRAFLLATSFCWCRSRRVPSPSRCRCPCRSRAMVGFTGKMGLPHPAISLPHRGQAPPLPGGQRLLQVGDGSASQPETHPTFQQG